MRISEDHFDPQKTPPSVDPSQPPVLRQPGRAGSAQSRVSGLFHADPQVGELGLQSSRGLPGRAGEQGPEEREPLQRVYARAGCLDRA